MIDATVAQRAKIAPARTADMQALCWGSQQGLSVPMYILTGVMLTAAGPRLLFACAIVTAMCVGLPAALGWLGETRRDGARGLTACMSTARIVYAEVTGSHCLLYTSPSPRDRG